MATVARSIPSLARRTDRDDQASLHRHHGCSLFSPGPQWSWVFVFPLASGFGTRHSGGKSTRTMNDRPTNSLRCARFLPDRHGLPADPHCGPCKAGLILRRVYQIEPITKHYRGMNNPFARSFNRSWIRILYSNWCGDNINNFKFKYLDNLFWDVYYVHVINKKQNPTRCYIGPG
jgi:hypothetical protein